MIRNGTLLLFHVLLLWLSFHPARLWPLGWVALIPLLLYLDRERKAWRAVLFSYAAGFAFFTIGFGWLRYIAIVAPPGLALVYGLQWGFFALMMRLLKGPRAVTAPALWVLLEWLRGTLPVVELPWFYLGHTQIDFVPFAQAADLGGVPLLSFVMVCAQGLATDVLIHRGFPPSRAWRRGAVAWTAGFGLLIAYGIVRLTTIEMRPGPRVLIVQPNIPQDFKEIVLKSKQSIEEVRRWRTRIYEKLVRLTDEGMAGVREPIDLIIWPEAAFLDPIWFENGRAPAQRYLPRLQLPARKHRTLFLCGLQIHEGDPPATFNSALLVGPGGNLRSRYDKTILVPFGEYIPFPALRKAVENYTGLGRFVDTTPGNGPVVMEAAGTPFSVVICFEGVLPGLCRRSAGKGVRAIVNISNDGWFRDSAELDQILAITRFRAIENRIGFVRATNTGISALIDPMGRIGKILEGPEGSRKEVSGTLVGNILLTDTGSVYRTLGHWTLGPLLVLALVFEVARRRRPTLS